MGKKSDKQIVSEIREAINDFNSGLIVKDRAFHEDWKMDEAYTLTLIQYLVGLGDKSDVGAVRDYKRAKRRSEKAADKNTPTP